jgi:hypothetical protein
MASAARAVCTAVVVASSRAYLPANVGSGPNQVAGFAAPSGSGPEQTVLGVPSIDCSCTTLRDWSSALKCCAPAHDELSRTVGVCAGIVFETR